MNPHVLKAIILDVAMRLLPPQMDSPAARAMLVAIALQESGLKHRRQIAFYKDGVPTYGPARGWFMFEMGGVEGVLSHHASRESAERICRLMGYDPTDERGVHLAIEHNDVLAVCFARLLLWTDPRLLPSADKPVDGWAQYLACWRPGKPHASTWNGHFAAAWAQMPGTVTT